MINSQIRASYWMTFPLIIENFNHFFIQPAPEVARCFQYMYSTVPDAIRMIVIGVRDGGGRGGQLPPPKITKSKSRANVQHKSGEEWEIKKPKMPKSPQFVGQTKAVGQYSLHSRAILAYYKKNWDKLCQFCG